MDRRLDRPLVLNGRLAFMLSGHWNASAQDKSKIKSGLDSKTTGPKSEVCWSQEASMHCSEDGTPVSAAYNRQEMGLGWDSWCILISKAQLRSEPGERACSRCKRLSPGSEGRLLSTVGCVSLCPLLAACQERRAGAQPLALSAATMQSQAQPREHSQRR